MNKLVTAVITTHNRLSLLKRAIDSVLSQTYSNIECIVVSDNSTDGTNDYCTSRNDIRFINIPANESHGGNYARNLGIKAAKGDYVAFLDDDDYWFPNKIEKQMELIRSKECDCVYCLRQMDVYRNGVLTSSKMESTERKIEGDCHSKVLRHSFTSTSCLLVSKSLLEEIGGFDENHIKLQEYELLIRICQLSEIFYVHHEPLLSYTINKDDRNRVSFGFKLPIAKAFIEKKHKNLLKTAKLADRIQFRDWMWNAMYSASIKNKRYGLAIKYAPYHYFSMPIHYLIKIVNKFKH